MEKLMIRYVHTQLGALRLALAVGLAGPFLCRIERFCASRRSGP